MTDKPYPACQASRQQKHGQRPRQTHAEKRICLGAIMGAYGVRGDVRIKTFTQDPLAIAAYGVLSSADGKSQFEIVKAVPHKMGVRATIKTITNRTQAESLKGTRLYISRPALPQLADGQDDFYHADLLGLTAVSPDGRNLGIVSAIYNFGAGDLLEIDSQLIAFTKANVPRIDIDAGRLVVRALMAESNDASSDEIKSDENNHMTDDKVTST